MRQPDWEALRAFSLVASTGSFAQAADTLGCAVSTVTRRIDGLEQALGLVLLHRSRTGATPTEIGHSILTTVDAAAQSLDQIPRQARQYKHFRDRQTVRISATETVINDILIARLGSLRARYPKLLVELESTNRHASLELGQTDLAVRLTLPENTHLIVRKLRPVSISVFVSPTQLEKREPASITLAGERIVWIDSGLGDIAENKLIDDLGIRDNLTLRATSVRALALACREGEGLAMLPHYLGKEMGLIPLNHIPVPQRSAWLVYHPETKRDPVVRAVRDWIVACFDRIAQC